MASTDVAAVNSRLVQELNVKVKQNWLRDCVNYFKNENPQINFNDLLESVKQQIFLASYKDSCDPVIPNTFKTRKDIWTLNQNLFLQMQFIVDISEPYYEQHRRLHNIQLDSTEEIRESRPFQIKKKRCLKLTLTDGAMTINAMENKPIPCLNTKLPPGVKILIKSPVKISNSIILLEAENIEVVGGEVDEIAIENAYENVLLRLLRRPITMTPITDYPEAQAEVIVPPINSRPQPNAPAINPHQNIETEIDKLSMDDDDIDMDMIRQIEEEEMRKMEEEERNKREEEEKASRLQQHPIDEQFSQLSEGTLEALGNEIASEELIQSTIAKAKQSTVQVLPSKPAPQQFSNPWNTSKSLNRTSFIDFQNNSRESIFTPETHDRQETPPQSFKKTSKATELLIPDKILTESMDVDDYVTGSAIGKRKSTEMGVNLFDRPQKSARLSTTPKKPKVTDKDYDYKIDCEYNFITIDQYSALKAVDKLSRKYAIQAKISRTRALKCLDSGWLLEVELADRWSKNILQAKFNDEIVAQWAGRTAQEMKLMKEKSKHQPQIRNDIENVLTALMNRFDKKLILIIETKILPPATYDVAIIQVAKNTDDNKHKIMLKIHDEDIDEIIV